MADERLGFDELFDPSLIRQIQELERVTKSFINTLETELTQSFSQVQKESKALQAQLKKSDATTAEGRKGIEQTAQSVKQLADQNEKLTQSQKALKKSSDATSNSLGELKRNLKEQQKEFESLDRSTAKGKKRFAELQEEIAQTRVAIREINTEVKKSEKNLEQQRRAIKGSAQSYQDLAQEARTTINRLKQIDGAIDQTTGEWNLQNKEVAKLVGRYNDVQKVLKSTDSQLGNFQRNVGDYNNAIRDALANVGGGRGGGILGIADSFSGLGGVANTILPGVGDGLADITTKLGPVGIAAGAVAGGFALAFDSAQDLAKEILPQLNQVQAVTGLVGKQLQELTGGIRATANAFEKDFNEVLKAVNVSQESFGLTGVESLSLINSALVQGIDLNGDLLDQIAEYGVQFEAAGFSAEQFLQIQRLATDQGIFNDKAADAVKEFGLRIRELTPATRDALIPLGEYNNEQIRTAVESGDTAKALSLVSKGLNEVELTAQQTQTIIADVFGGPGEDAGLEFLLSLENINAEFATLEDIAANVNNEFTAFQEAQAESLILSQELEEANVRVAAAFGTLGDQAGNVGTRIKTFFQNLFADFITIIRLQAAGITGFIKGISDVVTGDLRDIGKNIRAIGDRVAEEQFKVIQDINFQRKKAEDQAAADREKQAVEIANKEAENARKLGLEKLRIQTEINNLLLQRQIDAQEELAENEKGFTEDRIKAILELSDLRIKQAQNTFDAIIADESLSQQERELELLKHQDRIADIERDGIEMIRMIRVQGLDELSKLQKGFNDEETVTSEKNIEKLNDQLLKGLFDRQAQIKKQQDQEIADQKAAEEKRTAIVNASFEGLQLGLDTAFELRNNAIDAQFQSELAGLEARFNAELEAAGGNEEAKIEIQKRFDEERKQLEQERARQEKQSALFQAVINTAAAVAKALVGPPPLNFINAALAAATGAAQVATIAAAPIPKFEKGTKSSPEGLAVVGEAGAELIKSPQGDYALATEPSLEYLKKGSQVFTADETRALAEAAVMGEAGGALSVGNDAQVLASMMGSEISEVMKSIAEHEEKILDAVDNQRTYNFEVSKRGVDVMMKHRNNVTKYYQERYK